jgi:hypothetical protein
VKQKEVSQLKALLEANNCDVSSTKVDRKAFQNTVNEIRACFESDNFEYDCNRVFDYLALDETVFRFLALCKQSDQSWHFESGQVKVDRSVEKWLDSLMKKKFGESASHSYSAYKESYAYGLRNDKSLSAEIYGYVMDKDITTKKKRSNIAKSKDWANTDYNVVREQQKRSKGHSLSAIVKIDWSKY